MKIIGVIFITLTLALLLGILCFYSGSYNIGADARHWSLTTQLVGVLRDRSPGTEKGRRCRLWKIRLKCSRASDSTRRCVA